MSKICFVSFEIHPTTKGGAGVFLFNAANVLLNRGNDIVLLLDMPAFEFDHFNTIDRLSFPNNSHLKAYDVESLCHDIPLTKEDFSSIFLWNSYRFHYACSKVYAQEKPDLIEFFDYAGVAYYASLMKFVDMDYQEAHLAIRIHTTNEVMDANNPHEINREYYSNYSLEHQSLRLAEFTVYPSQTFLEKAFLPYYPEQWYGTKCLSVPPLIKFPRRETVQNDANIVLFFGRLDFLKGADIFVDAAVSALNRGALKSMQFFLVGHNSQAPVNSMAENYREFLIQKIPEKFRSQFFFTGPLKWNELEDLLPRVQFAVFPNHYESFCYSAHELYAAGIPLIVSSIPAFQDYFKDEENSLVFDQTTMDLERKMERLAEDPALRQKLSKPHAVADVKMSGFYDGFQIFKTPSDFRVKQLSLLICVLVDEPDDEGVRKTLESLPQGEEFRALIFKKRLPENFYEGSGVYWLGNLYDIYDYDGTQRSPLEIKTNDTLLLLRAGDELNISYIRQGLRILSNRPEIAFVGCWRKGLDGGISRIDTSPIDAMTEMLILDEIEVTSRCIMRTESGQNLVDLWDDRLGKFGEIGYIWNLDNGTSCGIVIPEIYIREKSFFREIIPYSIRAYLILKDPFTFRKIRLAKLLGGVAEKPILQKDEQFERPESGPVMEPQTTGWYIRHTLKTVLQKNVFLRKGVLMPLVAGWRYIKRSLLKRAGNY